MKILIMGLPGAGKTTLAAKLKNLLKAKWLNADEVRKQANDWDFSLEGRIRQAERMADLANKHKSDGHIVIADFVCPTPQARQIFSPDILIWMDTIKEGRFEDTNKVFQKPEKFDYRLTSKNADIWSIKIADKIIPYKWDNKKPTAQMLGRWQPWHLGHQKLFEEIIKKTGQVLIMVRDVKGVGDNPFEYNEVKENITKALRDFEQRIKIILVPNITNICYGRDVGYKIEEIVLSDEIQDISATKIRKKLREQGKLK